MLPEIGPVELVLILVIVTMLFGVGRLPEVFGAVGRGVREFRNAAKATDEVAAPPPAASATPVDVLAPADVPAVVDVPATVELPVAAPQREVPA